MIKGKFNAYMRIPSSKLRLSLRCSVMSGIITGPHFRKFFNNPGAIEVGTMVAVLEIGAFS